MKVYIVTWFSAESYSDSQGIQRVFHTRSGAEKYLAFMGKGPHGVDEANFDSGYFLSETIEEFPVDT